MNWKNHLLIMGIAIILLGICLLIVYIRENTKKYSLVQGKIIEVLKHLGPRVGEYKGFTHTPIIEYQYKGNTYKTEHRISAPTPDSTYKVNDIVELRVYEDKPDKAIINSRRNILMPLICGVGSLILGVILLTVSYFI